MLNIYLLGKKANLSAILLYKFTLLYKFIQLLIK